MNEKWVEVPYLIFNQIIKFYLMEEEEPNLIFFFKRPEKVLVTN